MNNNQGWTFGIITDGFHQKRVAEIIDSIVSQNIEKFEVIVVGDNKNKYSLRNENVSFYDFESFGFWDDSSIGQKFPISKKKNLIIDKAIYNKLCFLHDYVALDKNWYNGILKYEENYEWEVLTNIILNEDNSRVFDWVLYDHPIVYKKVTFLPYDKNISNRQYIPGYYWCGKKNIMEKFKLNEELKWGEKEDIEWSKRVRKKHRFSFNKFSKVRFLKFKDGPWSKMNTRNNKVVLRSNFIQLLFYLKLLK